MTHCAGRFENSQMNPLVSHCSEKSCYNHHNCRPTIVETHLTRSYLFWSQVCRTLTSGLPIKTPNGYGNEMNKISSKQGGLRLSTQLDLNGIFEHLHQKYKDSRPSEQNVMDQDFHVICGSNQSKLRRDFLVSIRKFY